MTHQEIQVFLAVAKMGSVSFLLRPSLCISHNRQSAGIFVAWRGSWVASFFSVGAAKGR